MKQLLIILLMVTAVNAGERHHYWTKHTTSVEPRESLKPDLMLVYTGTSNQWLTDWNNKMCDLWLAPSKDSDVVGYFRATVFVHPLLNSKKVFDLFEPELSDYFGTTKRRWFMQRNTTDLEGDSNELTFLGNTFFSMRTTVPYKRVGVAWIYGLHGWESLHTPIPAGGYFSPSSLDLNEWAECAYNVGRYKLKFSPGPTHNPGISEIAIKGVSMMLWSSEEPQGGEPYWYVANTKTVTTKTVAARVAVQRKGDANLDGKVNGSDIYYFNIAVNEPGRYQDLCYGVPAEFNCDLNYDGMVNGLDTGPFVKAVLEGGVKGDYWDSIGY